jgi:hypothetical protein
MANISGAWFSLGTIIVDRLPYDDWPNPNLLYFFKNVSQSETIYLMQALDHVTSAVLDSSDRLEYP